jgi:acetyl-CoA carboxylase biotin carboxyl carrier protein
LNPDHKATLSMATDKKLDNEPSEVIDAALVRQLADILNDTSLTEIEVERGELRIRVAREITAGPVMPYAAAPAAAAPSPVPAAAPAAAPAAMPSDPATIVAKSGEEVKSPMVGTVYLQPSPEADPFVQPGDKVKKGQTLLIVEAMKTMNPITAPRDDDAQPVEFGEPLVLLEA